MKIKYLLPIFLLLTSFSSLERPHPFSYDLHTTYLPGSTTRKMLCFHGMHGDHTIASYVKEHTQDSVISFNFPDHSLHPGDIAPEKTTFGTIQELLPPLYLLKIGILDEGWKEVDLYGFSAGGGAIINLLALLNSDREEEELKKIGIDKRGRAEILTILQKGVIILDAPLKSIAEVRDYRGASHDIDTLLQRYRANKMEPIEALAELDKLSFHFLLFFQNPDLILSNRDDSLYIERLKKYNAKGVTQVIIADDGSHCLPHPTLWKHLPCPCPISP